jgi:sugar-phosphatase
VSTPADLGVLISRRFDAVLFDLDGTLIDSTAAVERTWRRWGAEHGLAPGWHFAHGVPARQVLAGLVAPEQLEAAFAHVSRIELQDVDGVVVLPGASEALAALPPDRTAIATSGTTALAKLRIDHTRLPIPPVLVTADDVPLGKPDPAPYLLAAERLGADPSRCLVVEDAPAGLTSARAAGCATLAVSTTHRATELDADAVVPDLSAVRFVAGPDGVRIEARIEAPIERRIETV